MTYIDDVREAAVEKDGEKGQSALIVRPRGMGQTFMERLSLQFYKMTWRTPLYSGRLKVAGRFFSNTKWPTQAKP